MTRDDLTFDDLVEMVLLYRREKRVALTLEQAARLTELEAACDEFLAWLAHAFPVQQKARPPGE